MNLVDSSAWLEYFADGPNASFFSAAIEKSREVIVPTIVVLEVYKRILQQRNERAALEAVAVLGQGRVIDLTATLAIVSSQESSLRALAATDPQHTLHRWAAILLRDSPHCCK